MMAERREGRMQAFNRKCLVLILCTSTIGVLGARMAPAPVSAPAHAPAVAAAAGPQADTMQQAFTKAGGQKPSLLFIQQAKEAVLKIDPFNTTRGSLLLTGVPPSLVWFTDRPERAAGMLDTAFFSGPDFADRNGTWLTSPNAALYGSSVARPKGNDDNDDDDAHDDLNVPQHDTVVIVTLGPPTYDQLNATIKYEVTLVPVQEGVDGYNASGSLYQSFAAKRGSRATLLSHATGNLVFGNAALNIDDWSKGSGSGGWGKGGSGWGGVDRRGWHHWDKDWEGGRRFCPYGFKWG